MKSRHARWMPYRAAKQHDESDERREALRAHGRDRRAFHAERRNRSPAEDERRVEDEVQDHRSEHDEHRQLRPSPTPRISDWNMKKKKLNTRPTNDTRMKPSAPGSTSGATPISRSTRRRGDVADGAEHDGDEHDHEQRLRRDVIDHLLVPRAEVLRDQRRAGDGEAGAQARW